jgi:hypothetical protein
LGCFHQEDCGSLSASQEVAQASIRSGQRQIDLQSFGDLKAVSICSLTLNRSASGGLWFSPPESE